jgi:hypothetical protein
MRKLIAIAASIALVATIVPALAAGTTIHSVETWTNEPTDFYNGDGFCTGTPVAGPGLESGTAKITETANGGFHATGRTEGVYALYEATGPPWDVQFGAFVGTWSYTTRIDEQIAPGGNGSFGSVGNGTITYANGSTQKFQIVFRYVPNPDGPPRRFLVTFVCGPVMG